MHSIVEYPYGVTGPYAVNFTLGFLSRSHVTAFVRGELDSQGNQVYRDITWVDDGLVHVSGSTPYGSTLVISRDTPAAGLIHDYQDGAVLNEKNLDESNRQAVMLMQELHDGKRSALLYTDLDAQGFRVTGLAAGVADSDAVTVAQLQVVNALAETTVDRVEAAAAGVVAAGLIVDAQLQQSNSALFETTALANVVAASANTVEGLAGEVLAVSAGQAAVFNAAVSSVYSTTNDLLTAALAASADSLVHAESSLSSSLVSQSHASSAGTYAISAADSSVSSAESAAQAAAHEDAALAAVVSCNLVVASGVSECLAVKAATTSECAVIASTAATECSGYVQSSAMHEQDAEAASLVAGVEANRAAAYANSTGAAVSITSMFGDITSDVIDLESLEIPLSSFTNENYPQMRMDLAAESGITDLGGLI